MDYFHIQLNRRKIPNIHKNPIIFSVRFLQFLSIGTFINLPNIPGETGCLVCRGGFDPAMAAMELMDETNKRAHLSQGYVIGSRSEPTASIANLNGMTAQLGLCALLRLVMGETFGTWS